MWIRNSVTKYWLILKMWIVISRRNYTPIDQLSLMKINWMKSFIKINFKWTENGGSDGLRTWSTPSLNRQHSEMLMNYASTQLNSQLQNKIIICTIIIRKIRLCGWSFENEWVRILNFTIGPRKASLYLFSFPVKVHVYHIYSLIPNFTNKVYTCFPTGLIQD